TTFTPHLVVQPLIVGRTYPRMSTQLDLAALDNCLQGLGHLFIDIQRLRPEVGYEEKRGGYGDVQVSRLDPESSVSKLVAAKTVRLKARHKEPQRLAFRLARELKVWAGLRHPHVLALLGFYLDEDYKIAVLISEYMIHGDLKDYIDQDKPDWDKRLSLGNVLVSATRRAILADFGLSKALEEGPTGLTTSEGLKGTLRYYSPEVIRETCNGHSLPSDIWAWACLVLEVLADRIPYAEKKSEHSIILALMNNEPPSDTTTLPIPISALKGLLNKCWAIDPSERPSAEDCLQILNTEASSASVTIDLGSASSTLKDPQRFSSNQANPVNNSTRPLGESAQNSQQAHSVRSSQHVTEKKLWPAVGAKIQFLDVTNQSLFPEPEVADQLFKYYKKALANFEIHWNDLFRACDPSATFPLPSHLRYLRPEIERFAYNLLPVLLQQPGPLKVEDSQPSVNSRVSTNPGAPEPKNEDLMRYPSNEDIILEGTQNSRNLGVDIIEIREEREPMLPLQRIMKAQQAAERIASTQEKTSQGLLGEWLTSGSGATPAGESQTRDILPRPSDTQLPSSILLPWPGLNIPPEQLLKTQEKVEAVLEFYRKKIYPLVTLSQEQGVLLEYDIQQAHPVLQRVSQNIVHFFAVVDDEPDLEQVAEALVALLSQAQILQQYPLKKQFILGLDDLTEYKTRLSLFLMRVQGLQNPGLAGQHRHTPKTQSLGLLYPAFNGSDPSSSTHVPGAVPSSTETLQPSAGAAESSKPLSGPSTLRLPSKPSSRKRNLEGYATFLEDYYNLSDPCKRARTESHAPVDAQWTDDSDVLS
ncbi:hypothetical protein FRC01_002441, partial [Tulasnella sp. 417]